MIKYNYIWRIIFAIISIWIAIVIFSFSAENGNESKNTSGKLARWIVDTLPQTCNLSELEKQNIIEEKIQFIVRKFAHFSIYALLGINVMLFFLTFGWNIKKQIAVTIIICIIYAITDEIHQLYSIGRSAQLTDVIIDGLGSITGVICVIFLRKLNKFVEKCRKINSNVV